MFSIFVVACLVSYYPLSYSSTSRHVLIMLTDATCSWDIKSHPSKDIMSSAASSESTACGGSNRKSVPLTLIQEARETLKSSPVIHSPLIKLHIDTLPPGKQVLYLDVSLPRCTDHWGRFFVCRVLAVWYTIMLIMLIVVVCRVLNCYNTTKQWLWWTKLVSVLVNARTSVSDAVSSSPAKNWWSRYSSISKPKKLGNRAV